MENLTALQKQAMNVLRKEFRLGAFLEELVDNVSGVATKAYSSGTTAWTLSDAEATKNVLSVSGTPDGAFDVVATPTTGKFYLVINGTNQTATIKADGQTGVAVASGASVLVYGNGTDFVGISTSTSSYVTLTGTQTLTNKTLTAPVVNSPDLTHGVETAITLASGDVTLSAAQIKKSILEVSTGHATNGIIAPATLGKMFWVVNNHATLAALIKVTGQTGVTVAATKKALVYCNGTDYVRLTADA